MLMLAPISHWALQENSSPIEQGTMNSLDSSLLGIVSFAVLCYIPHLMLLFKFFQLCFLWENLLQSCTKANVDYQLSKNIQELLKFLFLLVPLLPLRKWKLENIFWQSGWRSWLLHFYPSSFSSMHWLLFCSSPPLVGTK